MTKVKIPPLLPTFSANLTITAPPKNQFSPSHRFTIQTLTTTLPVLPDEMHSPPNATPFQHYGNILFAGDVGSMASIVSLGSPLEGHCGFGYGTTVYSLSNSPMTI